VHFQFSGFFSLAVELGVMRDCWNQSCAFGLNKYIIRQWSEWHPSGKTKEENLAHRCHRALMGGHDQEIRLSSSRWEGRIKKSSVMVHDRGQLDCLRRDRSNLRRNVSFFFSKTIDGGSNCHNRRNAKKEKKNVDFVSDQFLREIMAWWELFEGNVIGNETRKSNEREGSESRIVRERESETTRYERTQTGSRRWTKKR
jgi:hypothetical protein